jgi:Flp pilus assembly protein TadG
MIRRRCSPAAGSADTRPSGRRQRGTVLVEAALIMPVLILLAMGTVEFGFAWRDRVDVQTTVRSAVRAGSSLSNDPQADYNILQMLKAGFGSRITNTTKIVIYKASATNGAVPTACLTSSQTGVCNVYTAASASLATSSFGCGTGAVDSAWCPNTRVVDIASASGPDYLGVYIAFNHGMITGSFGGGNLSIKDSAVMRLEPQ